MTEYLIPDTVEEALCLLEVHAGQAMIIAGGTDVLPDIREGQARARLPGGHHTHPSADGDSGRDGGYVTVGAAVTFAMLREHAYLGQHVHALVEAAASVGAAPIQAVATWGGNLVQAMPAADGAIIAIT